MQKKEEQKMKTETNDGLEQERKKIAMKEENTGWQQPKT